MIPVAAGLDYRPYQVEGISYMAQAVTAGRNGVLCADEPGLGKTIMAAGLINAFPEKFRRVLVVCPSSGRRNWQRELDKWLVRPLRSRLWGGETDTSGTDALITSYEHFLVPNAPRAPKDLRGAFRVLQRGGDLDAAFAAWTKEVYGDNTPHFDPMAVDQWKEDTRAAWGEYRKRAARRGKAQARFDAAFGGWWDLVIVDECKKIKNPKSARAQTVLKVASRFTLFLDGTPIMNRTVELFPVLSVIDPGDLGRDRLRFAQDYCGAWHNGFGWQWEWPAEMDVETCARKERVEAELSRKLHNGLMLRRLKQDVLTELPPKVRQIIRLESGGRVAAVDSRQRAAWAKVVDSHGYDSAVQKLLAGDGFTFQTLAADRIALAKLKLRPCVEYVEEMLEQESKIVVFAHHHVMLDGLTAGLARHGVVRLDGRTPDGKRQAVVDQFQDDPACRVFIGGNDAAGELITLTAASLCVICELPWNMSRVTQIEDRLHRLGQRDVVRCHHIVFDGTLDADFAQLIVEKQNSADNVLDRRPVKFGAAGDARGPEVRAEVVVPSAEPLTPRHAKPRKRETAMSKVMLTVEGTPEELAHILALMGGGCACAKQDAHPMMEMQDAPGKPVEEKAKRGRKPKAQAESEHPTTPAAEEAEAPATPAAEEAEAPVAPSAKEVTVEEVRALLVELGKATDGTSAAAKALISTETGKATFAEVTPDELPKLKAALETKLAEAAQKKAA